LSKEEFMQGCLNDETLYRLLACSHDDQESWDDRPSYNDVLLG
jgi:hypothetical protein